MKYYIEVLGSPHFAWCVKKPKYLHRDLSDAKTKKIYNRIARTKHKELLRFKVNEYLSAVQ